MKLRINAYHLLLIILFLYARPTYTLESHQVDVAFEDIKHQLQSLEETFKDCSQQKIEDPIVQQVIENIFEQSGKPSRTLLHCYRKVSQKESLSIREIIEIMPEMIEIIHSNEHNSDRGTRPNALGPNAPNALVGGGSSCGCDSTQLLALLGAIKKLLIACCAEIEIDISGIFTVLDNLTVSATVDLSGVFTALEACCTGVFTVLDNLIVTATVDFSGVFTALEACCTGVFTVLDNLTVTATVDFSGIFTVLACIQEIGITSPILISEEGIYCVQNDIDGLIEIAADNVVIHMNEKTVSGTVSIQIDPGSENILIQDGILAGSVVGLNSTDARNITLENIDFINSPIGSNILTSTCITFKNCTFSGLSENAIAVENSDSIIIDTIKAVNNSAIEGASLTILDLSNTRNIILNNFLFAQNNAGSFNGASFTNAANISLSHGIISTSTGSTSFSGLLFSDCNNIQLSGISILDSSVISNSSAAFGFGINVCSNVVLSNCIAQNLTSAGEGDITGFTNNLSFNIAYNNSIASNIVSGGGSFGFDNTDSTDVVYDHCISTSNTSSSVSEEAVGFFSNGSIKAIYIESLANNQIATTTASGFLLNNSTQSTILHCIAQQNMADDTARGFALIDCTNCQVEANIALGNSGGILTRGFDISDLTADTLTHLIIANKSTGHSTNYFVSPGTIPTVVMTIDPFFVSASPTPIDNLDVS